MYAQMLKTLLAERLAMEVADPGMDGENSAHVAKPVQEDVNQEPEHIHVVFDLKRTIRLVVLTKDSLLGQHGAHVP